MTMITPSYLGETIEYSSLHACRSTLEDPTVEALFDALWTNTDSTDAALARNVLKGRYTWLEDGIVDQSEGTGPWIAHWEAGASTEADLARRFLSVADS